MKRISNLRHIQTYRAFTVLVLVSRTALTAPQMRAPDPGEACWTGGFWGDWFARCHTRTLPALETAMRCPTNGAQLRNFELVGTPDARHSGNNWSDGDVYKWLEAMARVYAVTRDPPLLERMDEWIAKIARTQAEDGYISTQTQFNPAQPRWGARRYHELYNMGHLLTAAAVHHRASGRTNFLAVALRVAECLDRTFRPRPKELAHFGWNPSNIMGLMDLYRVTGDRRHLELAAIFVDMRGSEPWPSPDEWRVPLGDPHPGDQTQDRVPLRRERQAVGHAVTGAYLYSGAAEVASETGEAALLGALKAIWDDITGRKMYITGGTGAMRRGLSIRGDRVHEAYGGAYELPLRTAYNETCANIAHAMFSRQLLALTGEARYADVMELVLHNSMLSAISLDGARFFYTNPLERRREAPLESHDALERWTCWRCFCCPPSVARTIAGLADWAWSLSDDSLWVHLYGTGEIVAKLPGRGRIRVVQRSNFPWEGRVELGIIETPTEPWALRLRVPGWTASATLTLNGEPISAPDAGTYLVLQRTWRAGDRIGLEMPMPVRRVIADPRVESCRGRVAVMRGPVVYCVESVDLPEGVALGQVRLPLTGEFRARWMPELLGGVVAIEVEGRADEPAAADAFEALYRPAPAGARRIPLRLVPYFAWCNRGPGEMAVWLPATH